MMDANTLEAAEEMTREMLIHAAGPMLASGMSEHAVVKMCETVAQTFMTRALGRFKEQFPET